MSRRKGVPILSFTQRLRNVKQRRKPKFNKKRCLECKYHGFGHGYYVEMKGKKYPVYCNYASITDSTCLKPLNSEESYDLRGEDYENCLLFSSGDAIEEEKRPEEQEKAVKAVEEIIDEHQKYEI